MEEASLDCPYCGEFLTLLVDTSGGDQSYVEDCFVCCQPIVVAVRIGPDGEIESISGQQENG